MRIPRSPDDVRRLALRDGDKLAGPCNSCERFLFGRCVQDGTQEWREAYLYILAGVAHVVPRVSGYLPCAAHVRVKRFVR